MFSKIYFLLQLIALLALSSSSLANYINSISTEIINGNNKSLECLIHNKEYKYEYLFSSAYLYKRNVYTYPLKHLNDFNQIRWKLVKTPIDDDNVVYLTRNVNSQEYYLCASKQFADSCCQKKRRLLELIKFNSSFGIEQLGESCKWRLTDSSWDQDLENTNDILDRLEGINRNSMAKGIDEDIISDKTFLIWNVEFNEPLYSSMIKFHLHKRSVYLWRSKPDSDQFKWYIDCYSGAFLAS